MKEISVALIYIAFFALVGGVCWFTNSALPLWALLLAPSITTTKED
jgi:hypothetical protein